MKKLITVLCSVLIMGCASTAVEFKWDKYKETVCKQERVEGKKKFHVFPAYEKVCEEVEKEGWIPVGKMEVKGMTVKADFKERKMEGGSFLPPMPLKVQN